MSFPSRRPWPSWEFVYLLAVLAPWIISVIIKVWIGEWSLY